MASKSSNQNAGFGIRFVAYLIDAVVIIVANFIIQTVFKTINMEAIGTLASVLAGWGYLIYFTGSTGQTLGKKALGIKVVKVDTGKHPDYVGAFLRDVVGKFISGIVLALGYLWIIWDPKKQAWHDKIANTVVVKVK